MGSEAKRILPALTTVGVLAGIGLTALPMLPIWTTDEAPVPRFGLERPLLGSPSLSGSADSTEVVVDLRDNVSAADIQDIDQRFGLNLAFNSVEGQDDKLMVARVPASVNLGVLLDRLRQDGRVEVAEPERIYSLPETPILGDATALDQTEVDPDGLQTERQTFMPGVDYSAVQTVSSSVPVRLSFGHSADSESITCIYSVRVSQERSPREYLSLATSGYRANSFTPNDPRYNEQWNFRMIGAEDAWKRSTGKGVVVAVIDTGVSGTKSKKGKACKDFGDTAFVPGYDFVNKDSDPYDDHGHGTHVAGTIAESTNNSEGVAGLAFDAKIMPLKVLSASGSGTSADIADAIRWAADKGANVINMSLGSAYPSDVIHKAVKYARKKGVTIVCAAGNGFGAPVGYPAAYPECIAISSVGPSGDIATYSSYGKEVALAAPGGDMIESGNPADGILQNTNYPESQGGRGDDYYAFQGTSMASPHAAAAAAMLVSQGITDPARVRDILTQTAAPKNDKNKYGAGVLNVATATAKAQQLGGVKLRTLLMFGLGFLTFAMAGTRRRFGLRLGMAVALGLGFYGLDWFTNLVGADSAWNLIGFSAIAPILAYALLRKGPGVKVAGMLGVGTAVGLWANWHNDTLPFTTATFGATPLLWTSMNMLAALAVSYLAAMRVTKSSRS